MIRINDIVKMKSDTEVTPLNVVKANELGVVIDRTVPNYYLVKFANGTEWVDGDKLVKVQ